MFSGSMHLYGDFVVVVLGHEIRENKKRFKKNKALEPVIQVFDLNSRVAVLCDEVVFKEKLRFFHHPQGAVNDSLCAIKASGLVELNSMFTQTSIPIRRDTYPQVIREFTYLDGEFVHLNDSRVKHIHMNLHKLEKNKGIVHPRDVNHPIVVKHGGKGHYGHVIEADSGTLRYQPEKPILSCGAHVVMTTKSSVMVFT